MRSVRRKLKKRSRCRALPPRPMKMMMEDEEMTKYDDDDDDDDDGRGGEEKRGRRKKCKEKFTIRVVTCNERDAGLSEWQRGVDVAVIGSRASLDVYLKGAEKALDVQRRDDIARDATTEKMEENVVTGFRSYPFDRGAVCVHEMEVEDSIGDVQEVWIAPVAGRWMPERVEIKKTTALDEEVHAMTMECGERLDADDARRSYVVLKPGARPELAPLVAEEEARRAKAVAEGRSDAATRSLQSYSALKRRIVLAATAIAAVIGIAALALENADLKMAVNASRALGLGAFAGIVYVLLLGAGADEVARKSQKYRRDDTNVEKRTEVTPAAEAVAAAIQSLLGAPPLRLGVVAAAFAFAVVKSREGGGNSGDRFDALIQLGAAAASFTLTSRGSLAVAVVSRDADATEIALDVETNDDDGGGGGGDDDNFGSDEKT